MLTDDLVRGCPISSAFILELRGFVPGLWCVLLCFILYSFWKGDWICYMDQFIDTCLNCTLWPDETGHSIKTLSPKKTQRWVLIALVVKWSNAPVVWWWISVKLFHAILNTSQYLSAWKQWITVNLFKVTSPFWGENYNYEGLSINSSLAKVLIPFWVVD